MHYHLTFASRNRKTGPIPVATISNRTCPSSCPLKGNGCYAESGPLRLHWDAVSKGKRGTSFDDFCRRISMLPRHQLWRYGQAGDLPGDGDEIDGEALMKLAKANARRPIIAYTHKPPNEENLKHLRAAAQKGFTVNLSADSLEDADQLAEIGLPVVAVLPADYGRSKAGGTWAEDLRTYNERVSHMPTRTPEGRQIAVCPATYTDTDCGRCLLCASARKEVIIGFPAHGSRKRALNRSAQDANVTARPFPNEASCLT
jgi:hypothetical protein